jgi:inositol-phosphate transport system ATP-binding protein
MRVVLEGLTKRFGTVTALESLDLEIADGEFVALLGPSGCGKTTTLLLIAGIYQPSAGSITFGDRPVNDLSPAQRRVGMVFQSYALYPHMTVEQNIAFPIDVGTRVSAEERRRRVREAAELVQVAELLDRRPAQLSGGQQQRVALARAIVKRPDILLFDEPLSNLDARLRNEMRVEIKRLQKEIGITSVFVTHDQREALTMADRVALLHDGRLEAYATPQELYDEPRNRFVAEFIGDPRINLVPVDVERSDGTARLVSPDLSMRFELATSPATEALPPHATLAIRPEHMRLTGADDGSGDIRGEVYVTEPSGREQIVAVRCGDQTLSVIAPADVNVEIGDAVRLVLDRDRLHLFDTESGARLL